MIQTSPQSQLDLFSDLAPAPDPYASLPPVTAKALAALSDEKRAEVKANVNRHYRACMRQGTPTDEFKYVVSEAIILVRLGDKLDESGPVYEPARSYGQYKTPRVSAFYE